jgi:hypothetical protein
MTQITDSADIHKRAGIVALYLRKRYTILSKSLTPNSDAFKIRAIVSAGVDEYAEYYTIKIATSASPATKHWLAALTL